MSRPTALVTGASSGIGLDLARLFAREGHDLVLVARSGDRLRALGDELEAKHQVRAHVVTADLSKPHAAQEVVATLRQKGIEVDVLVNNAGYGLAGAFTATDLRTELEMIQVNIVALTELTKLLLPGMVARNRGGILNVASTAAFQPGPLMAVYYATKAYVLSFSEALAEELRNSGVHVTALCPGPTETGFAAVADMGGTRLFTMSKPMTSQKVAEAGFEGLQHGRRVVVPGLRNKLLAQSVRVSPRRLVATIVRKMQEKA